MIQVTEDDIQQARTAASSDEHLNPCLPALIRSLSTGWHESQSRGVLLEDESPHRSVVLPSWLVRCSGLDEADQPLQPFEFEAMICTID